MVGTWEGAGFISYKYRVDDAETPLEYEFSQRVTFAHDGHSYLTYHSTARLIGDDDRILPSELGYWRVARPFESADHGPGLLPGVGAASVQSPEDLERWRNATGGFDIEASIIHPNGISEHYLGDVLKGRIDLATGVGSSRPVNSPEYSGASRVYGLVEGDLLWAWDIAALGNPLTSHASARLKRID